MEIRVYDPELNYLGLVENHTSLIWTRKYYEPGNFELHAPITPDNLRLLQAGNIITRRSKSLKVGGSEAGVIEDVENEESDIKNALVRSGRFLSSYFDRRLIMSTVNFRGRVEDAMRQLVTGAIPLPLVELGQMGNFSETVTFQATMKNLQIYLTKLARSSGLGYRLRPDFTAKKMFFEVYKGTERTISQGVNSRVIFSHTYKNLNNAIYKYNDQLSKTQMIVGGEGEGAERVYVTVGGGSGLALRQAFADARDLQSEDLSPEQYLANLRQRGEEKLAECFIAENLTCETEPDINFRYREHYDLGDIVTIRQQSWGLDMHQRITEIQEVYQVGGMFVSPKFGDALPEKIDWGD